MLRQGQPYFLDYQGGRKGALQYDVASLLYDAKADLPPELRQQLLDYYLDALSGYIDLKRNVSICSTTTPDVYIRIMQALGAMDFAGSTSARCISCRACRIPRRTLARLLHNVTLPVALPTLMEAFHSMLASEKLQGLASDADNLVVRILSFSFHRGLPKDESGNGGGFVFDGRSLPNPVRRAFQGPERQRRWVNPIPQPAGERSIGCQRDVAGGLECDELSKLRVQEPDGVVRLYGWPASICVFG